MFLKERKATESLNLEESIKVLPSKEKAAERILARVDNIKHISPEDVILDIGAAQGLFLIACARKGYKAVGIEPDPRARAIAKSIAEKENIQITILDGTAGSLPFQSLSFDVVCASSVIEHVLNAEAAFAEVYRVLKPGGVFWFDTASSMSIFQEEIQGFPFFGWYPDRWKRLIMEWAKNNKPHLVGYTKFPAINWFTPKKARFMLKKAGFQRIYDRWDIRLLTEGGFFYRVLLKIIRSSVFMKFVADILIESCAYIAVR